MKEGKYIHYCWFGGKPLPKLAKKCLESWKKYLPEYEIIRWDENSFNLNECEFVKRAYETKNYAFVADYVRVSALNKMGGIYFDTDMEVIKDFHQIMEENDSFLGVEDTGNVNCAVWYEKYPKGYLTKKLLETYREFKNPDFEKRADFAIPILLTNILKECGFDFNKKSIQNLKHGITIFPRDYFYPYSYNRTNNVFTDRTCMIHYFDASWLPLNNRIENTLVRRYGRIKALKIIRLYQRSYVAARKTARIILFPVALYKLRRRSLRKITSDYLEQVNKTVTMINESFGASYIVLHNGEWFGVTSATKELFEHNIDCRELYRRKDINKVAKAISKSGVKQVIFSAMSIGGPKLVKRIYKLNKKIKIKVYWHGSMSQVLDSYGWKMHEEIIRLCRKGIIVAFATCKKSLLDFYKKQGINAFFITNRVDIARLDGGKRLARNKQAVKIGLYAANPYNWRKNMFSQMAAVSLIENSILDIVPLDPVAIQFADLLGLRVTGTEGNLSRDEMIARISENDVNLYVTFSECAPMLPLESLEVGVPCLTGNNHHYFANSILAKHLVINQETDINLIKKKIQDSIRDKKKILKEYEEFRKINAAESKKCLKRFMEA